MPKWQLWAIGAVALFIAGALGKHALDWHNLNERVRQQDITISLKEQALKDAMAANAVNVKTIEAMQRAQALDTEALAVLQKDVAVIAKRSAEGRTIIREVVANDPAAADWAKCPVPDRVLDALNTR